MSLIWNLWDIPIKKEFNNDFFESNCWYTYNTGTDLTLKAQNIQGHLLSKSHHDQYCYS